MALHGDHPRMAADGDAGGHRAPHTDQSVREAGAAGRDTLRAAKDTGRALRKLISADFALARSAFGRALAWAGVAIVFGATAWLLLNAALIALMVGQFGWSWLVAMVVCCLLNGVVTGVAIWRTGEFFDHMGMHATRRQLARIGIGDESSDDEPATPARGVPAEVGTPPAPPAVPGRPAP